LPPPGERVAAADRGVTVGAGAGANAAAAEAAAADEDAEIERGVEDEKDAAADREEGRSVSRDGDNTGPPTVSYPRDASAPDSPDDDDDPEADADEEDEDSADADADVGRAAGAVRAATDDSGFATKVKPPVPAAAAAEAY
jgi:hypothetical protein